MKSIFLSGFLVLAGSPLLAQRPGAISTRPLQSAAQVRQQLFDLPAGDSSYYFQVNLPGSDFLTIRFNRLSFWVPGQLSDVFKLAGDAAGQLQDSFSGSGTSSRRIALHVPPANAPVTVALQEWNQNERVMLFKGGGLQPLRIAADTISILKTRYGLVEEPCQLQYTFLLKDLEDMRSLAEDPQLIRQVERELDSLVAAKQTAWKHPDAPHHRLSLIYDAPAQKLQIGRAGRVKDFLVASEYLGVGFVAGTMAPAAMLGIGYRFNDFSGQSTIGLTVNTLSFFRTEDEKLRVRGLAYLNLEFGGSVNQYRTAVGFGYRIGANDPGPYDAKFHLYFSYSVSKVVTLMPDIYTSFPKKFGDASRPSFFGITALVRVL